MTKETTEEIELKKEKIQLKKKWTNAFLNELDVIMEKMFLRHKSKKEHFVTKDRIEVDLIRLLQSQKKYVHRPGFKTTLSCTCMFDLKENAVARIIKIDCLNRQVIGFSIFEKIIHRSFDEITFFDAYSVECAVAFEKQKVVNDFTFQETHRFLTQTLETKDLATA